MSNVKRVRIIGWYGSVLLYSEPVQGDEEEIDAFNAFTLIQRRIGALITNPHIGLEVKVHAIGGEQCELRLTGEEAVAVEYLSTFVDLIRTCGVLREARYWDLEEKTGPHSLTGE